MRLLLAEKAFRDAFCNLTLLGVADELRQRHFQILWHNDGD